MWGVGISYLMMGSVPYWVKRLKGKLNSSVLPFYKNISRCGLAVLVLSGVSLFLQEPYSYVLPVIPILVLALWLLKFANRLFIEAEV